MNADSDCRRCKWFARIASSLEKRQHRSGETVGRGDQPIRPHKTSVTYTDVNGLAPAVPSGKIGEVVETTPGFAILNAQDREVVVSAKSATVFGGAAANETVLAGSGNLTFFTGTGSGTILTGDGNNLIVTPLTGGGNLDHPHRQRQRHHRVRIRQRLHLRRWRQQQHHPWFRKRYRLLRRPRHHLWRFRFGDGQHCGRRRPGPWRRWRPDLHRRRQRQHRSRRRRQASSSMVAPVAACSRAALAATT